MLSARERALIAALASEAGVAARLLEAIAALPATSVHTPWSLLQAAHLTITAERQVETVTRRLVEIGAFVPALHGWCCDAASHACFSRASIALYAVEYYKAELHRDATEAQVVLTKPAQPSLLEVRLSERGWRAADLQPTERAFESLARRAQHRLAVMTPFLDAKGAQWLKTLLEKTPPNVERLLVLRMLDDAARPDYPVGYDSIAAWLNSEGIKVYNYSMRRAGGYGRETFHAKVVLCDDSAAYVGSSNMTAASLEHSMEMGVLLSGKAAAKVAVVVESVLAAADFWL